MATVASLNTFPLNGDPIAPRFDAALWLRTRFMAAVHALGNRGMDPEDAAPLARAFVEHWWSEVGPQRDHAEWNNNVGNVACEGTPDMDGQPFGWRGDCHHLLSGTYRSYPTLADGVSDYVRLQVRRYGPALAFLWQHPTMPADWYARILRAGYSTYTAEKVASFESIDRAFVSLAHNLTT